MVKTTTVSDRLRSPNFRSLINENILGKCFRSSSSFVNPRISPLTTKYECPRLSLSIITPGTQANRRSRSPVLLFHAKLFRGGEACFEHSNLLKVTPSTPGPPAAKPGEPVPDTRVGRGRCSLTGRGRTPAPGSGPSRPTRNPTTSFSTAAT